MTLYERKPVGLWAMDAVYVIIGLAIIGAIVGAMRKRAWATKLKTTLRNKCNVQQLT